MNSSIVVNPAGSTSRAGIRMHRDDADDAQVVVVRVLLPKPVTPSE
jgi:hypothetical protein